jgi:hypothetical protein
MLWTCPKWCLDMLERDNYLQVFVDEYGNIPNFSLTSELEYEIFKLRLQRSADVLCTEMDSITTEELEF